MHFAYPSRKSSNPPPFRPRSARIPALRRSRLKVIAAFGLAIIFLIWLFLGGSSKPYTQRVISGKPPVAIVTVFDEKSFSNNPEYLKSIKENREQYAEKHGYGTLLVSAGGYELGGAPLSWSKVTAMRHAMAVYPDAKYLWFLDQNAFIMNPSLKIEDALLSSSKLEASMIKDLPVVPPDSIIKTFSHLKGDDVEFVITQDKDGLSAGSFILRNGEWAQFFLDTWFDPLYRSYNFQKAETHALEHIVQWHPTILSKLAVIPQRLLNSYAKPKHGEVYEDGDLAVRFPACTRSAGNNNCIEQGKTFESKWRESFKNT
ncbi:galactosyl transferase GMA12/MNN10 family-domain-containing protein [Xylariales sp. AK1849]|nr:galactosyl transferase GMA12/MNN10 family-domain-containing protein [Xylariales sp. AK1849]